MLRFDSPAAVQAHFYRAIESGDAEAVMQAWSAHEPVLCIHPGAPRLDSLELISDSWQQILSGDAKLSFSLSEEHCLENPDLAVFTARVEISLDGEWIDTLLTTNVFNCGPQGWSLVVHHASPDPSFDEDNQSFDEIIDMDDDEDVVLH